MTRDIEGYACCMDNISKLGEGRTMTMDGGKWQCSVSLYWLLVQPQCVSDPIVNASKCRKGLQLMCTCSWEVEAKYENLNKGRHHVAMSGGGVNSVSNKWEKTKWFANVVLTSNSFLQVMDEWCLTKIELLAAECKNPAQWISCERNPLLLGHMLYY